MMEDLSASRVTLPQCVYDVRCYVRFLLPEAEILHNPVRTVEHYDLYTLLYYSSVMNVLQLNDKGT
jgi:hypothetical protein